MKIMTGQHIGPLMKNGNGTDTHKESTLYASCQEFEGLIIKQMLTVMRQSIPKEGLVSGGYGEEMFQSLQDEELAKDLARGGGLGYADALYNQLRPQMAGGGGEK